MNNNNNEGSQEEQDLDSLCANYVVSEPQVWEKAGMLPDKIVEVPESLVTLLFTSGMQVLHEGRLVLINKARQYILHMLCGVRLTRSINLFSGSGAPII